MMELMKCWNSQGGLKSVLLLLLLLKMGLTRARFLHEYKSQQLTKGGSESKGRPHHRYYIPIRNQDDGAAGAYAYDPMNHLIPRNNNEYDESNRARKFYYFSNESSDDKLASKQDKMPLEDDEYMSESASSRGKLFPPAAEGPQSPPLRRMRDDKSEDEVEVRYYTDPPTTSLYKTTPLPVVRPPQTTSLDYEVVSMGDEFDEMTPLDDDAARYQKDHSDADEYKDNKYPEIVNNKHQYYPSRRKSLEKPKVYGAVSSAVSSEGGYTDVRDTTTLFQPYSYNGEARKSPRSRRNYEDLSRHYQQQSYERDLSRFKTRKYNNNLGRYHYDSGRKRISRGSSRYEDTEEGSRRATPYKVEQKTNEVKRRDLYSPSKLLTPTSAHKKYSVFNKDKGKKRKIRTLHTYTNTFPRYRQEKKEEVERRLYAPRYRWRDNRQSKTTNDVWRYKGHRSGKQQFNQLLTFDDDAETLGGSEEWYQSPGGERYNMPPPTSSTSSTAGFIPPYRGKPKGLHHYAPSNRSGKLVTLYHQPPPVQGVKPYPFKQKLDLYYNSIHPDPMVEDYSKILHLLEKNGHVAFSR